MVPLKPSGSDALTTPESASPIPRTTLQQISGLIGRVRQSLGGRSTRRQTSHSPVLALESLEGRDYLSATPLFPVAFDYASAARYDTRALTAAEVAPVNNLVGQTPGDFIAINALKGAERNEMAALATLSPTDPARVGIEGNLLSIRADLYRISDHLFGVADQLDEYGVVFRDTNGLFSEPLPSTPYPDLQSTYPGQNTAWQDRQTEWQNLVNTLQTLNRDLTARLEAVRSQTEMSTVNQNVVGGATIANYGTMYFGQWIRGQTIAAVSQSGFTSSGGNLRSIGGKNGEAPNWNQPAIGTDSFRLVFEYPYVTKAAAVQLTGTSERVQVKVVYANRTDIIEAKGGDRVRLTDETLQEITVTNLGTGTIGLRSIDQRTAPAPTEAQITTAQNADATVIQLRGNIATRTNQLNDANNSWKLAGVQLSQNVLQYEAASGFTAQTALGDDIGTRLTLRLAAFEREAAADTLHVREAGERFINWIKTELQSLDIATPDATAEERYAKTLWFDMALPVLKQGLELLAGHHPEFATNPLYVSTRLETERLTLQNTSEKQLLTALTTAINNASTPSAELSAQMRLHASGIHLEAGTTEQLWYGRKQTSSEENGPVSILHVNATGVPTINSGGITLGTTTGLDFSQYHGSVYGSSLQFAPGTNNITVEAYSNGKLVATVVPDAAGLVTIQRPEVLSDLIIKRTNANPVQLLSASLVADTVHMPGGGNPLSPQTNRAVAQAVTLPAVTTYMRPFSEQPRQVSLDPTRYTRITVAGYGRDTKITELRYFADQYGNTTGILPSQFFTKIDDYNWIVHPGAPASVIVQVSNGQVYYLGSTAGFQWEYAQSTVVANSAQELVSTGPLNVEVAVIQKYNKRDDAHTILTSLPSQVDQAQFPVGTTPMGFVAEIRNTGSVGGAVKVELFGVGNNFTADTLGAPQHSDTFQMTPGGKILLQSSVTFTGVSTETGNVVARITYPDGRVAVQAIAGNMMYKQLSFSKPIVVNGVATGQRESINPYSPSDQRRIFTALNRAIIAFTTQGRTDQAASIKNSLVAALSGGADPKTIVSDVAANITALGVTIPSSPVTVTSTPQQTQEFVEVIKLQNVQSDINTLTRTERRAAMTASNSTDPRIVKWREQSGKKTLDQIVSAVKSGEIYGVGGNDSSPILITGSDYYGDPFEPITFGSYIQNSRTINRAEVYAMYYKENLSPSDAEALFQWVQQSPNDALMFGQVVAGSTMQETIQRLVSAAAHGGFSFAGSKNLPATVNDTEKLKMTVLHTMYDPLKPTPTFPDYKTGQPTFVNPTTVAGRTIAGMFQRIGQAKSYYDFVILAEEMQRVTNIASSKILQTIGPCTAQLTATELIPTLTRLQALFEAGQYPVFGASLYNSTSQQIVNSATGKPSYSTADGYVRVRFDYINPGILSRAGRVEVLNEADQVIGGSPLELTFENQMFVDIPMSTILGKISSSLLNGQTAANLKIRVSIQPTLLSGGLLFDSGSRISNTTNSFSLSNIGSLSTLQSSEQRDRESLVLSQIRSNFYLANPQSATWNIASHAHQDDAYNAIDLSVNDKMPVFAPADGTVVYNKVDSRGNPTIILEHSMSLSGKTFYWYTKYLHMYYDTNSGLVGVRNTDGTVNGWAVGTTLKASSQLGNAGSFGQSTGPHLHEETFMAPDGKKLSAGQFFGTVAMDQRLLLTDPVNGVGMTKIKATSQAEGNYQTTLDVTWNPVVNLWFNAENNLCFDRSQQAPGVSGNTTSWVAKTANFDASKPETWKRVAWDADNNGWFLWDSATSTWSVSNGKRSQWKNTDHGFDFILI